MSRRLCLLIAGFVLLSASGCVQETTEGGVTRIGYEWWVTGVWAVAGLIAGPAGWALRSPSPRIGWVMLAASPICLIGVAPTMALTGAEVSDEAFAVHSGIWGATAGGEGRFDDLTGLRQMSETRTSRRGRRTTYYLHYDSKTGKGGKFSLGNDVALRAGEKIVEVADRKGIPFSDLTAH